MNLHYRSYSDLSSLIVKNMEAITREGFDLIVGVPRSGMIPASMIALFLNIQCCSFSELYTNNEIKKYGSRTILNEVFYPQDAKKILIVEDSFGTGKKLHDFVMSLPQYVRSKCTVTAIYSAHEKLPADGVLDFYFEYIPKPRIFEWNVYHHNLVRNSAFDIDGVICVDPTESENDDAEKYLTFLRNARPKFIPTLPIHTLVTSRLEKYRPQTEEWLQRNNVMYSHLFMLDLPSKEERKRLNVYARHKASIYCNKELLLFFESNDKQAKEICELAGKPVFCVESNKLYS